MPFDGHRKVVPTHVELISHRSGYMEHRHTDRTSTADSGTSSIGVASDPILLNNISSVSDSDQPSAAEVADSRSCNKALSGHESDLGTSDGVDKGPAASTSKEEGGSNSPALPGSLKHPRKSLPLLPRMCQYQRHPLLQARSGTGLSEFEMLMLEKELFKKRCSIDNRHPSDSAAESGASSARGSLRDEEPKLIPRSAHYESHPLLMKSVSGVCELELYLMEKEAEVVRRQRGIPLDGDDDDDDDDDDDVDDDDDNSRTAKRQGLPKLEPRLNQWEKHALLEVKDKSGLSEVDRLFLETEQQQQQQQTEQERGKCGAECVCKSTTCKRCKRNQKLQQQQQKALQPPTSSVQQQYSEVAWCKGDSSVTSEDLPSGTSAAPLLCQKPSGQQKRVHFERPKNETDDSGIASSDASCQATRQDDVNAPEVSPGNSNSRQLKSDVEHRKETETDDTATGKDDKMNRGACRTDKQQPTKRSCCMS